MSTHEIFAAFVVNRPAGGEPDQTPLEWVGDRAGRAGLAPQVAAPDPADQGAESLPYRDALPYMEGDWLGMPVELRFVEGEDYRALVVVVGHAAFMRRVVRSSDAFLEGVVSAFREACDAITPTYAYLVTAPEDDIPGRLKQVSVDLRDRDPGALTGLGLPLAYLDGALAADPPSEMPASGNPASVEQAARASAEQEPERALRVPARSGVVLVAGDSLTGWL
ncbi:hypothetical protein [Rugosimonospora africana]|uniref:Uncharacterized protein n=1 Tax=Rugosimonospora africana TaxID=556532 RepID=A0A8J3VT07_9ACTN|nr:hypothetical protein [Rugosimonospora africana]GIH17695.1 hypothetical protein Raf01_58670 [Rugosimonospora africana]